MKFLGRIFIGFILLILLVGILSTIYLKLYGKKAIVAALRSSFKTTVDIDDVYYHFPLGVTAYNISVNNTFKAQAVSAQINFDSILSKKLSLRNLILIRPEVIVHQTKHESPSDAAQNQPASAPAPTTNFPEEVKSKTINHSVPVYIKKIVIENGQIKYSNEDENNNFKFQLENVQLRADHFVYPFTSMQTDFQLSGRLAKDKSPLSGGLVKSSGWVNVAARDMEATLEVKEVDQKGGLWANLFSRANRMTVQGDLKVKNLMMKSSKHPDSQMASLNDVVSGMLSSMGLEIGAKFSFETKMDQFELNNVSFTGNVSSQSMPNMLPNAAVQK